MGKLVYAINTSLDGYIEDASGSFDWSEPDEAVHEYYNDLMRGTGTQLLGRRMYETMAVWETDPSLAAESPVLAEFAAAWQDSDKLVYSASLSEPFTSRTGVVRAFDADEVRALKEEVSTDLLIGGPGLAAHALRSGVVDEISIVVFPVVVGAGKPAFASDVQLDLELIGEHGFANGTVRVTYRVLP